MRKGYILLHRQGLTPDEWKHPLRTLAWIDLLTLAAWDDRTEKDGTVVRRGEIIASETFLAQRWRQNRGTIHRWLLYWQSQRMVQRVVQQPSKQLPQRLFVVNYAKYQEVPQRPSHRLSQRVPQRPPQTIERSTERNQEKETNRTVGFEKLIVKHLRKQGIKNPHSWMLTLRKKTSDSAIAKAWGEWQRGVGITTPGQFWSRVVELHEAA